MANEIVELPKQDSALQVFTATKGLDPYLEKIRAEVRGFKPDTSTRKGREAIASLAFKVSKIKTAMDGMGKTLVEEYKEVPKKIDAERKRMRDELDALRDEARKPLTEWEEAEEARIARHKAGIEWFRLRTVEIHDLDVQELTANIAEVEARAIDESWEEFAVEAANAQSKALQALRARLAERQKYEAEQAELAELRAQAAEQERKDNEARIAQEAADKARREAEARARAEREADAKRVADAEREKVEAQQAAERAEREAEDRAKRAAEAERAKVAAEQAQAEAETRRREADKAHRATVNTAALKALVGGGIPEDCAKQAIILIAQGLVPAIKINY